MTLSKVNRLQAIKQSIGFDDFIAVAEDLIARNITSPRRLGIQGGSHGGLLVGACLVQRPEIFNAVVCEVPLLDMLRYTELHAGASWVDEYGDPNKTEDRAVLAAYSPYHHIQPVSKFENRNEMVADVVGPICETGDYFARDRKITQSKAGELLAVMSAGAYGMVMTSNYNARRRPAEILVDGDKYSVIRSRETFDHLIWDEKIL